jgi:phage terminase large subunit-like protein
LGYGERAVNFLRNLRHPKSRAPGRAFQLDPWMERIVRAIYSPRHLDDDPENQIRKGDRIINSVFLMVPRGNRKTSLGAALTLLHTIGPERRPLGQVVCAAADQKQARIAFDEAASILRQDRRLTPLVKISDARNRVTNRKHGTWLEALSADGATQHGRTPDFVLMDELHAWKNSSLWEALKTGLAKVPSSLNVIITTAGRGSAGVPFDQYHYARRVAYGEIDDPGLLPILFEAPKDADWRDEAVWREVNPGLRYGYPALSGLRQLAREAANRPADCASFKQLHLNQWADGAADPFCDLETYDKGSAPFTAEGLDELRTAPCWLAVDLSSNRDLTVIVAAWRDGAEGYIVRPWFFCPRDNLEDRERYSGQPYRQWATDGLVTATEGNVVDFRAVEMKIRELCDEFDVQEIAFDPHLARNILNNLLEDGLPAVEMRQGAITMMPAIKELDRAITGERLRHGGHPVLRWNFENTEVETNSLGHLVRLTKSKRKLPIDGTVAAAMAVARASAGETKYLKYEPIILEAA